MNLKILFLIISVALLLVSCAPEEEAAEITISSIDEATGEITEKTETNESTAEQETPEGPVPPAAVVGSYEIIEIEDLKFKPNEMTITSGTMVKWIHNDLYGDSDNIKHIIRIYKKGEVFNAQSLPMFFGDSYNYTFTGPGEYYYISIVYAPRGVRGDITVE